MKVLVSLKVVNADEHNKDRSYTRQLDLQVFPSTGSSLVIKSGKDQRTFTVIYFAQVIEDENQVLPPIVFLKSDYQIFKGDPFYKMCEELERLGFIWDESVDS